MFLWNIMLSNRRKARWKEYVLHGSIYIIFIKRWVLSLVLEVRIIVNFEQEHWRRKWQPTPVFLPGESQGRWAAVYEVAQSRTRLKQLGSSSSSGWSLRPLPTRICDSSCFGSICAPHRGLCAPLYLRSVSCFSSMSTKGCNLHWLHQPHIF